MRPALPAALLALCTAGPALATGGIECSPVRGRGPTIHLVIGHGAGPSVVGAWLIEGNRRLSTQEGAAPLAIGQSWIDARYLWLDLLEHGGSRYAARLRASFQPRVRGRPAVGTIVRNGRTYNVRCVEA